MKKTVPFIYSLIMGLFSGLFIACFLYIASIITSPFANFETSNTLIFAVIALLVSVMIIIVIVIADIMFLMRLNNKKKMRLVLILQACATIFICLLPWHYTAQVIDILCKSF